MRVKQSVNISQKDDYHASPQSMIAAESAISDCVVRTKISKPPKADKGRYSEKLVRSIN